MLRCGHCSALTLSGIPAAKSLHEKSSWYPTKHEYSTQNVHMDTLGHASTWKTTCSSTYHTVLTIWSINIYIYIQYYWVVCLLDGKMGGRRWMANVTHSSVDTLRLPSNKQGYLSNALRLPSYLQGYLSITFKCPLVRLMCALRYILSGKTAPPRYPWGYLEVTLQSYGR